MHAYMAFRDPVASESPVLQLNEAGDKVRPIHKRCTLILREIPEGTKKEVRLVIICMCRR